MKFDQDLCATYDMNSTLGSVVPLAMFTFGSYLNVQYAIENYQVGTSAAVFNIYYWTKSRCEETES